MKPINRRDFLGTTATGAAAIAGVAQTTRKARPAGQAPSPQTRIALPRDPNRRLATGLIGCGWFGMVDLKAALQAGGVEAVALCDVDSQHLSDAVAEVQKLQAQTPKGFKDYRELLKTPGLDVVIIATPPQWHALPFIAACEQGLDVYCEKPLAYDIREGRAMVNAARAAKNVVQIGFQRRNSLASAQAADYIRQGLAGKIIQVEAEINYTAPLESNVIQDPPPSLDWDFWCGPAPKLPYCPNIGHRTWRLEVNYGNGHMVDWGIHWLDAIRRILGLGAPDTIQAMGGIYRLRGKITTPDVLVAVFEFDSLPVIWRHRLWGSTELDRSMTNRAVFYGDKETVVVTDSRWAVMPGGKESQLKVIEAPTAQPSAIHMMNFLECVRSRGTPICEPSDGYLSTIIPQLGMISYHAGAKIKWDAQAEQIPDNPNASKLLKRDYRAPWKHPANAFA